jgi:bifunctional DNA-binding transcriptional regulator/antitoxin component of YhaV-PrlF toxin-antitoxin module
LTSSLCKKLEEIERYSEWLGRLIYLSPKHSIMWAKVDARGRLYIPRSLRSKISKEVYLVEVKDGILVIPKPEDPIKELEEIGRAIPPDKPVDEIKKDILKQAMEELE